MTYHHGGEICDKDIRLDFSVNTNPLGMPEAVRRVVRESIPRLEAYPDPSCGELRAALAMKLGVPEKTLFFGNGASEIISLAAAAIQPKRALVTAPSFFGYERALIGVHADIRRFALKEEGGFRLTEAILPAIGEADMIYLADPNNPTGRRIAPELLTRIIDRCEQSHTYLLLDESFLRLSVGKSIAENDWEHSADMPLGRVRDAASHPHLIVISSFTKTYAMPGLRLGYAVCGDKALMERMRLLQPEWSVSGAAQLAGVQALKEDAYLQKARALIRKERTYFSEGLLRLGCRVYPGAANFILFATACELYESLLKKGILIRDCANFAGLERGTYRVAVRRHAENEALLENISEIVSMSNTYADIGNAMKGSSLK